MLVGVVIEYDDVKDEDEDDCYCVCTYLDQYLGDDDQESDEYEDLDYEGEDGLSIEEDCEDDAFESECE
ncbi:MAG: hypothetical protein EZS28_006290 [Streblomastix strix]|uniref:Uncharacterized protein n=1 Tax=Streblomastix strix TaxID=222440 RepID=A0A5J4WUE7_9EUKA|nr:MAG: hypothetical protein EZS28_006290 [Streblomastix strix]